MVDDGRRTDGRRTDGRTTEHGYTTSSPCEPDGSGELKKGFSWVYSSRICLLDEMRITTPVDVQSSHLYKCPDRI